MKQAFNLGDLVGEGVPSDKVALVDLREENPKEFTFKDIDRIAGGVAAWLTRMNLPSGSRVAISSENRVEFVSSYFGIMRAGFVAVPINYKLSRNVVAHIVQDAKISLALADRLRLESLPTGLDAVDFDDGGPHGFWARIQPEEFATRRPSGRQVAQILYTSGSTGLPKGVPLTHEGQLWVLNKPLPKEAHSDTHLVAQPLFHMNGLLAMKFAFRAGAKLVLLPAFDAHRYACAIDRYKVSNVLAVPTMFARLLRELEGRSGLDLSSLRKVQLGSAPMTLSMLQRIQAALPSALVVAGYGTTEAGPSPFGAHPDGRPLPPLALGVETPGSEVKLIGGSSSDEGVLLMRNPTVMSGYLNLPDESAKVLRDGWYYSGDVMRRDENGFYYFVGRADDMFVCAGENIHPGEVERMLEQHENVRQAAVVPLPDEERSHVPVAFVVVRSGCPMSSEELKQHALASGPAYQYPRRIRFVSDLPWAGTNKIDRVELIKRAIQLEAEQAWSD